MEHNDIPAGELHSPFQWVVADASARTSLTPDATDLYKQCLQLSDATEWVLLSVAPITWGASYTHPATHPATMITEDATHRFATDAEKTAWSAKEPGITSGTTSQYWCGDKTWADLAASVRATVLTGLSTATNAAIAATDSILSAIGKLQAQISNLLVSPITTGATIVGVNMSAQYPSQLTIAESTHATSRRSSLGIGYGWALLQDLAANGTKDLAIYNNVLAKTVLYADASGNILATSGGYFGYGGGAGGSVTQATSKSTAVTLNKPCGQIITSNAALAAGATVQFIVTNSLVAAQDVPVVAPSWTTSPNYSVRVDQVSAGSFIVSLKNETAGSLAEAVVINYALIKGAAS